MVKNRWQILLGGLFLAFLIFTSWSVRQAGSRVSPVADPDYYHSGQLYHENSLAWRAAAGEGWQALLGREGDSLRLRLLDGSGGAVSGATVVIKTARIGNGVVDEWRVELPESASGIYQAELLNFPAVPVELVFTAARGASLLERRFRALSDRWDELQL